MRTSGRESVLLGSFTSAVGLALGELLLSAGQPGELRRGLALIEIAAYGTLLSSGLRANPSRGPSLATAALRVVQVWHEGGEDPARLERAIGALREALEAMGVHHVPASLSRETGKER